MKPPSGGPNPGAAGPGPGDGPEAGVKPSLGVRRRAASPAARALLPAPRPCTPRGAADAGGGPRGPAILASKQSGRGYGSFGVRPVSLPVNQPDETKESSDGVSETRDDGRRCEPDRPWHDDVGRTEHGKRGARADRLRARPGR